MSIELFKPYVDFVFKGLFKNSPNALKDFIAAVQGWEPERIQTLQYLDHSLHKQDIEGKSGAVDLLVQLDSGEKIHFEVQVIPQPFYPERSLYYAARLYGDQLNRGESYTELQPLVCIHILLFHLFEGSHAFNSFQLMNTRSYKPLTQHLNMVFLELKKIESDNSLNEHLKHWMEFMREPAEHRQQLEKTQAFQEAYEELEKLSKDPSQRLAYFSAFKRLKDEESREIDARILKEREVAQGRAEGEAAGKAAAQIEVIKNLSAIGMSAQQISEIVKINIEVVVQTLNLKQ